DVAHLGGQVDFTRPDRIVVTIPETAVDALKKHDAVKYIQKLVVGKSVGANQAPPSIMRISMQSSALHPASTGTLEWKSGTYTYDPMGDLASDAASAYAYDPLLQMREKDYGIVDSEMYVYTADDERIGVKTDDTWTWSLRDFGGKVIRQYQSSQVMPMMGWL